MKTKTIDALAESHERQKIWQDYCSGKISHNQYLLLAKNSEERKKYLLRRR